MALCFPPRQITSALFAGLIAALALHFSPGPPAAVAATAALLNFPSAACGSSPSVSFAWQTADGAIEVWLDVTSEDNGFAPGSFQGNGPFGGTISSFTIMGLKADTPYQARVNSRTATGWAPSNSVAFVPCGAPQLLSYAPVCAGEAAAASFRWAPATPPVVAQSIEAGSDQGFAPADTRNSGPLLPLASSFDMAGLRANVTNYFRITATLADGSTRRSLVHQFSTTCSSGPFAITSDELVHTADRLVYSRLKINAPVNTRKVGYDGFMGLPEGKDDVVLYDFSAYRTLGGAPGRGGTGVFAGHLDFRPNFQAVFWDLAKAREGDIIDYYTADGARYSYQVAWVSLIPSDETLNQYFLSTDPETIILITCEGNFDTTLRNYDKRALVYAVAVNN